MHAAGVLPAREEERQGSAVWEQITQKIPGNNEKNRYLGIENYSRLYWRDPTVIKTEGSPRTFSTVP